MRNCLTAVVMAGGRGSRLRGLVEKPLVWLCGKPLIDYVLDALASSSLVGEVFVAVSKHTPLTRDYVERMRGLRAVETPAKGFVLDYQFALERLGLDSALVVSSDLPLLRSKTIDRLSEVFLSRGVELVWAAVKASDLRKLGLRPREVLVEESVELAPIGLLAVDSVCVRKAHLSQKAYPLKEPLEGLNVNDMRSWEKAFEAVQRGWLGEKPSL